jgi:diguanylate cyclase (GGDEF)-like protein
MSSIANVQNRIYTLAGRALKPVVPKREITKLLPSGVFTSQGKLSTVFIRPLVTEINKAYPQGGRTAADEFIRELRNRDLVSKVLEPGRVYDAMVWERRNIAKLFGIHRGTTELTRKMMALQELVQELGLNPIANRKIAIRCIREALGFSGVRIYDLNLLKGTWLERSSAGEQGLSRFRFAKVPANKSEKAFIKRLLCSEVPPHKIAEAKAAGIWEWHRKGEWGYFYIPDRTRKECREFVERAQVEKDQEGDKVQRRKGYGSGSAKEILYLVFGKGSKTRQVYMITNWASKQPLFADKAKDLELLRTFATAVARASALAASYQREKRITVHDPLTGVYNFRYFESHLRKECVRADRNKLPLSLIMIDTDRFKEINDTHGHPAGNFVLKELAKIFQELIRADIDAAARLGGDEFAVILPATSSAGAKIVAIRIREKIEAHDFQFNGRKIPVTASLGVDTRHPKKHDQPNPDTNHVKSLIANADSALYLAKRGIPKRPGHPGRRGRNQVIVYSSPG